MISNDATARAVCEPRSGKDLDMKKALALLCLCFMLPSASFAASSRENLQNRIDAAERVMHEIMTASDNSIPMNILQQATCVGVVPGLKKGAFIWGGQYGQGVVTCRTGHGWSAPVFIRMAGGSFGLQIGGQSTDLVLVAVNDRPARWAATAPPPPTGGWAPSCSATRATAGCLPALTWTAPA
jgi:hypothetical protein